MRAPPPPVDTAVIAAHLEVAAGADAVRAIESGVAPAGAELVEVILDEASRFAETYLVPLNDAADAKGARIVDARVVTPTGHRAAWNAFVAGGWSTIDHPEAIGGQSLPLALTIAVQSIFDRACPAFGMLPVPQRSAARLVAAHGDVGLKAEWLPRLVSGEWGATICISEPEAGSDVGRIRTRAEPDGAGGWRITGEKCWISFGDHDLTPRIGHCLLARTPDAAAGGAGLSLFLVPDTDEGGARNGVVLRRIEHKMGLHGSPTCALGFEDARGRMIGSEGRGLAQMFVMITNMRLSVGAQGLGIASAATDTALGYAEERRQGGPPDAPVAIADHADVRRMLLDAVAATECLRGLLLATANHADVAAHATDADMRADAMALTQWLLPIAKTMGGEVATAAADAAIQVLGGAGYTREWPVEQAYRDARVLTIYEGTTGIQALDLTHRRLLRGDRRGYSVFLREARAAAEQAPEPERARFLRCLALLEEAANDLIAATDAARIDASATAFLHLAALAALGWSAIILAALDPTTPARRRLAAAGRHRLHDIDARAALLRRWVAAGGETLAAFADVRNPS